MFLVSLFLFLARGSVYQVTTAGFKLTLGLNSIVIIANPEDFYCFKANYMQTVGDFTNDQSILTGNIYAINHTKQGYLLFKPKGMSVANLYIYAFSYPSDLQSYDIYINPSTDLKFSIGHEESNDLTMGIGQSNHVVLLADYEFTVSINMTGIAPEDRLGLTWGTDYSDLQKDTSTTLSRSHGGRFSWISSGASCSESIAFEVKEVFPTTAKSMIHLTQENIYCAFDEDTCIAPTFSSLTYKSCKEYDIHKDSEITTIGLIMIVVICALVLIALIVTLGFCFCSKSYGSQYYPVQDTPYSGIESLNPNYFDSVQQNSNSNSNNQSKPVELPPSSTTLYAPPPTQSQPKKSPELPGNSTSLYIPESPENQYGYPQASSSYNQNESVNPYAEVAKNPGFQPPPQPPI